MSPSGCVKIFAVIAQRAPTASRYGTTLARKLFKTRRLTHLGNSPNLRKHRAVHSLVLAAYVFKAALAECLTHLGVLEDASATRSFVT